MKHTKIFLVLNVWLRSSVGCSIQSSSTRLWYESRPSLAFFRLLFCYCLNCSSLARIFSALQEKNPPPPTFLFMMVDQHFNVLMPGQLHLIRSFGGTFRSAPRVNSYQTHGGTNSLNMNIVTTPTSTSHSNRV